MEVCACFALVKAVPKQSSCATPKSKRSWHCKGTDDFVSIAFVECILALCGINVLGALGPLRTSTGRLFLSLIFSYNAIDRILKSAFRIALF